MAERDLVVRFIGDDRHLQQAFNRSERRAGQFDSRMTKLNQSLRGGLTGLGSRSSLLFGSAAFLSTATLTAGIEASVDAASDLEEQTAKVGQVFRQSAPDIERWAQTTAEGMGIAQRQALAAAGTFGNLFNVIDIAPERSAEMSRALVQLAADLASFNNASPEDVLVAIRSGLIGEAEPLRRYGVLLSEARVQQIALANTGKDNIKALTDQEKALARYEIIMRDTATAQGDFARTSDGLANQSRILRAELDDLSATLGGVLVPAFLGATRGANTLLGGLGALTDGIRDLGGEGFDEANASLDQLVGRAAEIQNLRASFVGPELEELRAQIVAVGSELNRVGASERLITAFRQASRQIDDAMRDGIITPLEEAQLQATELGRIFLEVAPTDVLRGLGASVRSGLEDATAAAKVGVADLGAEIRSGIEDASREAVVAARQGGQDTGNAFAEGLQAASARIAGQVKGLGEAVIRAQIEGDQDAELAALRQQQERLQRQLRLQEQIVAAGGRGAGTAREKIRKQLLPQLLAITNAIDSINDERDAAREQARQQTEAENEKDKRLMEDAAKKQEDAAREAARNARRRRQGRQFEALGLTDTGDERTPGRVALRRRLRSLRDQVRGTALDTAQTQQQLDKIKAVLSGKFGEVGRDVRAAILGMFNDISSALEQGDAKLGPLTRTSGLNTKKIVAGLGLSEEEINALRGRLSGFNTAGLALAGGSRTTGGALAGFGGAQGAVLIDNFVTVEIDGQKISSTVTKQQQKARRRNPRQKRGPNRNI